MKIVCLSDTHNQHRKLHVPDGDLLIHSGDATGEGTFKEVAAFLCWLDALPHPHKILVAGNHDFLFERHPDIAALLLQDHPGITYLQDSGCEVGGLRIWGSPWQPWFHDWAFNLPRRGQRLRDFWNRIPVGTDVLVTHCPPYGVRDQVGQGEHLGCEELAIRLAVVKPRLHVFGHIHDAYGVAQSSITTYVNASSCTEAYKISNPPIAVDLEPSAIAVQGIHPTELRQRMDDLRRYLASNPNRHQDEVSILMSSTQRECLCAIRDIQQVDLEALLLRYVEHGIASDLKRLQRVEHHPMHRTVPFIRLEETNPQWVRD